MKMESARRFTATHQSITFSRRMMMLGAAQAGVGALLIGRLGWISIAENEHYQLLSESNRVQLIIVPPRRGWIVDRKNKPIAINRSDFRVDIIPDQLERPAQTLTALRQLLNIPPEDFQRILDELKAAKGYRPVQVAENVPYDNYAAITVRLPELPASSRCAASPVFTPPDPRSDTSSAMSAPPQPRNMKKRRTRCSSRPVSRSVRKGLKKRWKCDFAACPEASASS